MPPIDTDYENERRGREHRVMREAQAMQALLMGAVIWVSVTGLAEAQRTVTLGEAFTMGAGERVAVGGATVTVAFETVREDSRCPVGVTCVWAGDAVVVIIVDGGSTGEETVDLHTNDRFDTDTVLDGYTVRLVDLAPRRQDGVTITIDQYQATLLVEGRND